MRSLGILGSVEWQFLVDISGRPISPNFRGPTVPNESRSHSSRSGSHKPRKQCKIFTWLCMQSFVNCRRRI